MCVHWVSLSTGTNQEVAHSWKFAAGEIFSVLTKVRNDGLVGESHLQQLTTLRDYWGAK